MNVRAIRSAACCVGAAAALLIWAAGASAAGVTFTVTGFGDGTNPCSGTVCPTLRAAVIAANADPPATISLGAGTYELNGALQLDASTGSGNALTITGAGPTATVIQQEDQDRVSDITGGGPYLFSQLEVTGGHFVSTGTTDAFGGGIDAGFSVLNLDHVLVTGNTVTGGAGASGSGATGGWAFGGGIFDEAGVATGVINDSTIAGNSATGGNGGSFTGSSAGGSGGDAYGGGLDVDSYTITGSTIDDNTVTGGVGGSSTAGSGGHSGEGEGGGLGSQDAETLILVNSTVTGNTANGAAGGTGSSAGSDFGGVGGGIGAEVEGRLALFNDTITANSALGPADEAGGGDVADTSPPSTGETIEMADTDISGGVAGYDNDCSLPALGYGAFYDDLGYNLEDDVPAAGAKPQCEPAGAAASTDLVGVSPKLGALAANGGVTETELPQAGSPLIGNGGSCEAPSSPGVYTPLAPLSTDQRGDTRAGACDIGAVQLQAAARGGAYPSVSGTFSAGDTVTCSAAGAFTGDELTYTYAWLFGGNPIPGQTGTTYTIAQGMNGGGSLSCAVTATGTVGGPVTWDSQPMLVTGPGVISWKKEVRPRLTGKSVRLEMNCQGGTINCTGKLLIRAKVHGKKASTIASVSYEINAAAEKIIKVKLSKRAVTWLHKHHHRKLSARLTLTPRYGAKLSYKITIARN